MAAVDAVQFLIHDHGTPSEGFRKDFADDKPYSSILQRNSMTLSDVLEDLFDWNEDASEWTGEYGGKKDLMKLVKGRRKACFCIGGWREFNEDFGRGDVSCLRDIRTPLVTSRFPLKTMEDEFSA